MLDPTLCRQRQKRLLAGLPERFDAVIIALPWHVYYLTGHWPFWQHQAALILAEDGHAHLISANAPAPTAAADSHDAYEANWKSTLRQEQPEVLAEKVLEHLRQRNARKLGMDTSLTGMRVLWASTGTAISIDSVLWQMRRRKDPDELALMKKAIEASEAMHQTARRIIRPGINEIDLFAELHAAAVRSTGEPMTALLGNDYAVARGGGPASGSRRAEDGDLYIIDVGPTYRGYFADNCRTYCVNGRPTDAQRRAWEAVVGVFPIIERLARPGVRCRDLYAEVDAHFRQRSFTSGMPHHLGHGVGLQPHEYPHLNPRWDDVLIEGEIFTCEPGQYAPELRGGIRIENQYLVTADGVQNLLNVPLDL